MRYIGDIYRPPGEWKSYLLQCTVGCSHNACTFCGMYKNKRYYVRPLKDILDDIDMAREHFTDFSSFPLGVPNVTRVFLCDGDAIAMDTEDLLTIRYHVGAGYGIAGREDTEAVKTMARLEGIFLDPVYTGKAFAHFLQLLREGYFTGENILFLHSGGAGGLFAVELPE